MSRYSKFLAALLGAIATIAGIEMDEAALSQGAALVSAVLVYALPNRG